MEREDNTGNSDERGERYRPPAQAASRVDASVSVGWAPPTNAFPANLRRVPPGDTMASARYSIGSFHRIPEFFPFTGNCCHTPSHNRGYKPQASRLIYVIQAARLAYSEVCVPNHTADSAETSRLLMQISAGHHLSSTTCPTAFRIRVFTMLRRSFKPWLPLVRPSRDF